MRHFFYCAIIVIVACVGSVATHAAAVLTPNARLALLQKRVDAKASRHANTSRNDEFTAADPIRWGYGKIDAAAGIDYLKQSTALNELPAEQPSQPENSLWYDITGRSYRTQPTAPGIYIHNGKKICVSRMP